MLTLIVILMGLGICLGILAWQKRWSPLRRLASGLLLSYFTIVLILGIGEAYFRYVYAESENIITLACQNWLDRYWHTNSLGFRDHEWTLDDMAGKQIVAVLGDSFAAGWGLVNPEDRFSNVLAQELGNDYAVVNLAVYGTSTPEQLEILQNYPLRKPDVVILQYFLNDINYAGLKLGLLPTPNPLPQLMKESYLANFIYWRLLVASNADNPLYTDWWQWSYDAYDNVGIWDVHRQEIEDMIDYVNSIGARLVVVIFPNMVDPVRSVAYVDRVAQVFIDYGQAGVLKLFDAVAAWKPEDAMVSRRDSHPSAAFHHYVAETLYEQFFASQQLGK